MLVDLLHLRLTVFSYDKANHIQPQSCGRKSAWIFTLSVHLELVSVTLQGINISHIGKRKIIFKMPFLGDMLVPWSVYIND